MNFLKSKNNGEPCTSRGVSTVRREVWANLPPKDGKGSFLLYKLFYSKITEAADGTETYATPVATQ